MNFMKKERFIEAKTVELTEILNKKVSDLIAHYFTEEGKPLNPKAQMDFEAKVQKLTSLYVLELDRVIQLGIRMAQHEALHSQHVSLQKHLGKNFERVKGLILDE